MLQRRPKQYPFRHDANLIYLPDKKGKMKPHHTDDPGGAGWEIAAEALVCPECVPRSNSAAWETQPTRLTAPDRKGA